MRLKTGWNMRPMRARLWRSYLCIGLLSLLCMLIIFGASYRIILQQTHQAFSDVLKASSSILDGKIAQIQDAANEIASSDNVMAALDSGAHRPVNRQALINAQASEELGDYCQRIDGLISANIYRLYDEKVIASECCAQAQTYFDMRYRNSDSNLTISYEQWLSLMQEQYKGLWETTLNSVDGKKRVCYLRSLPLAGSAADSMPQATLMLEIDENFFTDYYDELGLENELILEIITREGVQIWGMYDQAVNASSTTVLSETSETTGWSYRLYVPNHLLMRRMHSLIWISLAVFLLLEAANLLLIPRFVERHYGPISQMLSSISQKLGVQISETDLAVVQTQFERLIQEQRHTLSTVENLKSAMHQVALINLLLGSGDPESMRILERDELESRFFMVVVITGISGALNEEQAHRLSEMIVGEEGFLDGEWVRFNGSAVFLIDCTFLNEEDRRINIELMQERLSDTEYLLGVSQIYQGREDIAQAYREAKWQSQYAALIRGQNADKSNFRLLDTQSLDESARLVNQIAGRDLSACQTIHWLFEHNRQNCLVNPALAHVLISVIMSDLLKNSSQRFPGYESELVDTWNRCLGVDQYNRQEELLAELTQKLCQRPRNEVSSRELLKQEIFQYIRQHYADCNLSIESIADAFGRSVATLSRVFREGGAENTITAEIARQRIEVACRLLSSSGDTTIAAISKEVGYSSMATFMRHFKQQMGVAPGRYRELSHQEKY